MTANLFHRLLIIILLSTLNCLAVAKDVKKSNFTGIWSGYFGYDNQPKTVGGDFSLALVHQGNSIGGEIIELVMSNQKVTVAKSTIQGVYNNSTFNFIKSYDGSGGRDHSVNYEVKFENGLLIGKWTAGELSGPVVLSPIPSREYAEFLERRFPEKNASAKTNQ